MEQYAGGNRDLGARRNARSASRQRRKADTTTQQEPDSSNASTAEKKTRRPRKLRKEPMCKVQGCTASVANMKTLNVRYRICDTHAKAPVVMQDGEQMRFCQQCSRLQPVGEFDESKRSCRYKLELIGKRRKSRLESENKAQLQSPAATGVSASRSGRLFTPQALQAHHLGADSATAEVDDEREGHEASERVGTLLRGESSRMAAATSSGVLPPGRQSLSGAFKVGVGGQPLSLRSGTSLIGRKRTHQSRESKPAAAGLPFDARQQDSNPLYDTAAAAGASSFDFGLGLVPHTSSEVAGTSGPIPLLGLQSMGHVSWLPDPPLHNDSHHYNHHQPPPLTRQLSIQPAGPASLLEKDDSTDLSILPDDLLPISPGSYFMPQLPNQPRPW